VIILLGLIIALAAFSASRIGAAPPAEGQYPPATGQLKFGPEVSQTDRTLVEGAITRARPEAQRLLSEVLGNVTVTIGSPGSGIAGETRWEGGVFTVELDLGLVYRLLGARGTDRLVLHELGHVLDVASTTPALDASLDLQTPRGYGCKDGINGACAVPRERFAEGFSKWATGDIGAQAGAVLGYQILPPSDLERWGRDLTAGIRSR
jgi:hypothetical protein